MVVGKLKFKVMQGRSGYALKILTNGKNLVKECLRDLHYEMLALALMYGCVTLVFVGSGR